MRTLRPERERYRLKLSKEVLSNYVCEKSPLLIMRVVVAIRLTAMSPPHVLINMVSGWKSGESFMALARQGFLQIEPKAGVQIPHSLLSGVI